LLLWKNEKKIKKKDLADTIGSESPIQAHSGLVQPIPRGNSAEGSRFGPFDKPSKVSRILSFAQKQQSGRQQL
jgi:hypothetical protein